MENHSLLISILVSVYNEEKTILDVLKRLSDIKKFGHSIEVIVINDGSSDNSEKIINENKHLIDKLISNETNRGKGYSIKKGLESSNGKYIIFQDADLEYDPNDFLKFFKLIEKFNPDLIIGSRLNYSDYTRSYNILNKFGNKLITFLFNIIYNTTFTDIYSCYVCFKKDLLNINSLKTVGFEQHAEILCKVVKKGKKFYEVPINYNGRDYEE
jgi:glycosyltransferase involved in cell wall biosynthesis